MPVPITVIQNSQQLEAAVSGPAPAARLIVVSGTGNVSLFASANAGSSDTRKETFTVQVGPQLARGQFVSAIATASPAQIQFNMGDPPNANVQWGVDFVDADFDEESGKTELRIEASLQVNSTSASITRIAFQATILATA